MVGNGLLVGRAARAGVLAVIVMALGACAHESRGNEQTAVAPTGGVASPWGWECPIVVPATDVVVTDIPEGIILTLTTRSANVQELRRSAVNLAAEYNERFDSEGPPVRRRYVPSPAPLAGGGYGSRAGHGAVALEIPGRPASRAIVEVIPRGAKVVFRTDSKVEVRYLRSRVTKQAVQMWAGTCPSVG